MEIANITVDQLRLNPHNDRHGPLRDEASAVQWLLENRTAHMRALATDIAEKKRLFEYPLIHSDRETYVVFDGNRRVCCIKLLLKPKLAPSEKWFEFFSDLSNDDVRKAFSLVQCEIETDIEIIDEKLFRRHTGTQEGIGQSQWDAEGKSNFLYRTGKESIGLGQSIERELKASERIGPDINLPWSNLERLFSSEPIRKRVSLSFAGGELKYLGDKDSALSTLQQIASDLTGRKIVLEDLWNNEKKGQYLDRLKASGFPVDGAIGAQGSQARDTTQPQPTPLRTAPRGRPKDKHLISSVDHNPFVHIPEMGRAEQIWRELQFALEFDKHNNAIAVLMRVLLELSIVHYAGKQRIGFNAGESFAGRVSAVADSLLSRGAIDAKARSIIRKFETDKPIVSTHSMHQYVHNPNFHPTKTDMRAIWHVIRTIIIHSVI